MGEYETSQFWRKEGLLHVIPSVGGEHPEGHDPSAVINSLLPDGMIVEVGCGYGRVARGLDPSRYKGVDVNPSAVLKARELVPTHVFETVEDSDSLPHGTNVFAYTVALHISDQNVQPFLARICGGAMKRVLIGEIMDARWRREGNPPVFNRDPEEYVMRMGALGWKLASFLKLPYARYVGTPMAADKDPRVTHLVFERR